MKINFLILPLPEYIPTATGQTREKYIQPQRKSHLDFEDRLPSVIHRQKKNKLTERIQ